MRIALVSPFDPFPRHDDPGHAHAGGVERCYAEVSHRLARRGHDVTLVCSTDDPGGTEVEGDLRIVRRSRRLVLLRTPVARLHRHLPPGSELVQVPATYPFTTAPVLRHAHRMGIPCVLDFHFEPASANPLGRAAAAVYGKVGPRAHRLADAVLVRSLAYGRSSASLAGVPESCWRTVPNGIDPQRFRPTGPTTSGDYVLFVGRLVPYKGVGVLLRAMAGMRPRLPLVVAGDGPLRSRLEVLARRSGVNARFLGRVPDERLPGLYRRAAVTVLPSINRQEAFGMTLLESMACGTPVVASGLPGVADVARLGGLVARPGDPADLAVQVQRAVQPGLLARGPALSAPIHAAYSWEAVTDRLEAAYQDVLARRSTAKTEVSPVADPVGHTLL